VITLKQFFFAAFGLTTFASAPFSAHASEVALDQSFTDITASTARETLSNDAPDWTTTHLAIVHQFAPRQSLRFDISRVSRFGLRDETVTVAAYTPVSNKTTLYFEAMKSREHNFLPSNAIQAQLLQSFEQGYGAAVSVRHARYDTSNVTIGEITLEKYFDNYSAAVTVYPSHSSSAGNAVSYRAAGAYYYGQRSNLQISLSRGNELDRAAAFLPITSTDIRSINIYGRHAFDDAWALDYALGRATRAHLTHHEFGAGVSFRFQ